MLACRILLFDSDIWITWLPDIEDVASSFVGATDLDFVYIIIEVRHDFWDFYLRFIAIDGSGKKN